MTTDTRTDAPVELADAIAFSFRSATRGREKERIIPDDFDCEKLARIAARVVEGREEWRSAAVSNAMDRFNYRLGEIHATKSPDAHGITDEMVEAALEAEFKAFYPDNLDSLTAPHNLHWYEMRAALTAANSVVGYEGEIYSAQRLKELLDDRDRFLVSKDLFSEYARTAPITAAQATDRNLITKEQLREAIFRSKSFRKICESAVTANFLSADIADEAYSFVEAIRALTTKTGSET